MITGDTGPMHLAAALDVPLVAVFGPSDPRRWGPASGRAHVVRADLACSPCNRIRRPPARCRGHVPDCLAAVTADQVYEAACAAAGECRRDGRRDHDRDREHGGRRAPRGAGCLPRRRGGREGGTRRQRVDQVAARRAGRRTCRCGIASRSGATRCGGLPSSTCTSDGWSWTSSARSPRSTRCSCASGRWPSAWPTAARWRSHLARACAAKRQVTWRGAPSPRRASWGRRIEPVLRGALYTASAAAERFKPGRRRAASDGTVAVAAFVHAAFWRPDTEDESYIGPVLREVSRLVGDRRLVLVGLGPRDELPVAHLVATAGRVLHATVRAALPPRRQLRIQSSDRAVGPASGGSATRTGTHCCEATRSGPPACCAAATSGRCCATSSPGSPTCSSPGRRARWTRSAPRSTRSDRASPSPTRRPADRGGRSCSRRGGAASAWSACSTDSSTGTG